MMITLTKAQNPVQSIGAFIFYYGGLNLDTIRS
jgi:hypothetical protein